MAKIALIFSEFGRAVRGLVRLYRTKSGQNISQNAICEAFIFLIYWNFLNFFSFFKNPYYHYNVRCLYKVYLLFLNIRLTCEAFSGAFFFIFCKF